MGAGDWIAGHLPWLGGWVCLLSLFGFFQMGWDKRQAKRQGRRVPERALFLTALLGGSPGSLAGMLCFRHKTKHWYFKCGLPAILLLQAGLLIWLVLGG